MIISRRYGARCSGDIWKRIVASELRPLSSSSIWPTLSTRPERIQLFSSLSSSSSSSSSSWQDHQLSWREPTKADYAKARKLVALKHQKDELEDSLHTAVRVYLSQEFPKGFVCQSAKDLWKIVDNKPDLSEKARTLLALNGFEQVPLPIALDSVRLAEGVIAYPAFYRRISYSNDVKYLLFSQPMTADDELVDPKKKRNYPPIVQEDIRLYRVLENQAERLIRGLYNWWHSFVKRRIKEPIARFMHWAYDVLKHPISYLSSLSFGRKKPEPEEESTDVVVANSDEDNLDRLENLLVFGPDEIVLYSRMTPSTRLVALPYYLGHKGASTLVSVSLVVFGAIPLAYRSLNYAFLYPGLSEALAISVIFTISYGIASQRYNARTSQSQAVANAMLRRVQARDDSAVWTLQEQAVRQTSRAILAEYFQRLELDNDTLSFLAIPQAPTTNQQNDMVNPVDVAIRLGLLQPVDDSENAKLKPVVPLKHAALHVQQQSSLTQ